MPKVSASVVHMAGIVHILNVVHSFWSIHQGSWILDSGASEHMSSEQTVMV